MNETKTLTGFLILVYIAITGFVILAKIIGWHSVELWKCFVSTLPILILPFIFCWILGKISNKGE